MIPGINIAQENLLQMVPFYTLATPGDNAAGTEYLGFVIFPGDI